MVLNRHLIRSLHPLLLAIELAVLDRLSGSRLARRLAHEDGQTSAEYALVVLGAVGVALLVGAWAQHTNKITDLLNALFDTITKHVTK